MKVAVIGTGRVGLPLALSMIDAGLDVIGVDVDPRIRQAVNEHRKMPFCEPGYDELIGSGKLNVVSSVSEAEFVDYFIITVGTPVLPHIETDLSHVTKVILSLCDVLVRGQTIIMRSTTAPRTTQYVSHLIERHTNLKVGRDVMLACCPERIVEGRARDELRSLPQIVGTQDRRSAKSAERLFRAMGVETLHCDWATAEMVKLFCNVSRYAYFAVINALTMVALDLGVEPHEVIGLANRDYPRKLQGRPGFTAGTCLRKDFGMLAERYWSGNILTEAWRTNESLPKFLVEHARQRLGTLHDKNVAVLGYAFKADTDDVRDSLVPKLLRYLERETPARIMVTDPHVSASDVLPISGMEFTPDMDSALWGADLVIIATNHGLYAEERQKIIDAARVHGASVIDIWNICDQGSVYFDQRWLVAKQANARRAMAA